MHTPRYKHTTELFGSGPTSLQNLEQKINKLKTLNKYAHAILGKEIASHVSIANLRDSTLVLIAESGVWATRLRYAMGELMPKFRQEAAFYYVANIEIIVRGGETTPPQKAPAESINFLSISKESAQILQNLANCIEEPSLKEQLNLIAMKAKY